MKLHVFKSAKFYGFDTRIDGANLPKEQGPWVKWQTVEMEREDGPRIGINSADVIDAIELHGYYLAAKGGSVS